MGLGRDATTYGFCKENRDDIVECGREVTWVVLLTAYRAVYQKLFRSIIVVLKIFKLFFNFQILFYIVFFTYKK